MEYSLLVNNYCFICIQSGFVVKVAMKALRNEFTDEEGLLTQPWRGRPDLVARTFFIKAQGTRELRHAIYSEDTLPMPSPSNPGNEVCLTHVYFFSYMEKISLTPPQKFDGVISAEIPATTPNSTT
jgi:hypothetical protein